MTGERTDARARAREPAHEPKRIARICERIRGGLSVDASCWSEGIDPQAVRAAGVHHPEVKIALEQARADAEAARVRRLETLIEEGKPTGGATWLLERLHPSQYHLPSKVHLGGDEEAGPVQTTIKITLAEATEAAREREGER
jgi:hypothetical protein